MSNKRHTPSSTTDLMVYGKVPPQAKDLEKSVLGACMLERSALERVCEFIKSEKAFYFDAHQEIFRAYKSLISKSQPIDILTVVEELRVMGNLEKVGGPYYLTTLQDYVLIAHIEAHSAIVWQKFLQREVIRIGGMAVSDGYMDSTDPFDLIDSLETQLMQLRGTTGKKLVSLSDLAMPYIERRDMLRNMNTAITGISSGYRALDIHTSGWQPTDLIILAARPAVGKTAFALNLARNAYQQGTPVGFFSLEMSAGQLHERIISAVSEVPLDLVKNPKGCSQNDERKIQDALEEFEVMKKTIFIDDTAALSVMEMRAKARKMVKQGACLIILDYLQLMRGEDKNGRNREQDISQISRELKILAKELSVPIIALSQLSREVEKRTEKMPQLSDLRESGAIEQDADIVMFLYRPEYYGITADAMGEDTRGETHVRIAKNRNGTLETVKLQALLHIQKFVEWNDLPPQLPVGGSWKPYKEDDNQ